MERKTFSLPVLPIPNAVPLPHLELYDVSDKLMKMKLRIAQLEESLKKSQKSKAASNADITEFSKMVQEETKLSCNLDHYVTKETANQSRIRTVDDLIKTECEKLNYNYRSIKDGNRLESKYPALHVFVTRKFDAQPSYHTPMLSHIIYNNISILSLIESMISYSEYKKLISSPQLQQVQIWSSNIIDESGKKMDVADLLKAVPMIKCFIYEFKNGLKTSRIAQKLSQFPPFPNLEEIRILNIHGNFDLEAFGEFIKQNPSASYKLEFNCSSEYLAEIKSIEKDLIPTLPSTCILEIKH